MHQIEEENIPHSPTASEIIYDKERSSIEGGRISVPVYSPNSTRQSSINLAPNNIYFTNERKMSSPICEYYHSSQKFLSQLFEQKTKEKGYDLYKSGNYIDKDSLLNGYNLGEGYYNNINKFNSSGRNSYPALRENNMVNNCYFGNNQMFYQGEESNDSKVSYYDDFNQNTNFYTYNNRSSNTSNSYMEMEFDFLQYQPQQNKIKANSNSNISSSVSQINNASSTASSSTNINNSIGLGSGIQAKMKQKKVIPGLNNVKDKKKTKTFVEREGDWICSSCKNLNFAFRKLCNRCQAPKSDNDVIIKVGNNGYRNRNSNFNNLEMDFEY